MSAITFNWAPFEIETAAEAPTKSAVAIKKGSRREDEFRAALESYMVGYRNHRARIANKDTHQTRS